MIFGRREAPYGRMIRPGGLAAQSYCLIDRERRRILVRGRRRSQHEIALRRDSHVIAVVRQQGVAQGVHARLDQLLAVVLDRVWKANCADERALRELREDHTQSLRGVGLSRNGFAQPKVAYGAAGAGDANPRLRERSTNGCGELFGRRFIEPFRFVGLRRGAACGAYEKSKEEKAKQKLPRPKRLHWRAPQKKRIGFSARLWPRP